jgi:hypothetical protein
VGEFLVATSALSSGEKIRIKLSRVRQEMAVEIRAEGK